MKFIFEMLLEEFPTTINSLRILFELSKYLDMKEKMLKIEIPCTFKLSTLYNSL